MNKKHLNGVFRLNTSAGQAYAVYVRLGTIQGVSDPSLQRYVGQPLKTLVRWLENQTKDIPWETVSIAAAAPSDGVPGSVSSTS